MARLLSGCRIVRSPVILILPVSTSLPIVALTDERSVPDYHGGYVPVVAKDAQGAGIEQEMLASAGGQANPWICFGIIPSYPP
jgi:hypothetical protein